MAGAKLLPYGPEEDVGAELSFDEEKDPFVPMKNKCLYLLPGDSQ
jgi:hypothetical protein